MDHALKEVSIITQIVKDNKIIKKIEKRNNETKHVQTHHRDLIDSVNIASVYYWMYEKFQTHCKLNTNWKIVNDTVVINNDVDKLIIQTMHQKCLRANTHVTCLSNNPNVKLNINGHRYVSVFSPLSQTLFYPFWENNVWTMCKYHGSMIKYLNSSIYFLV